MKADSYAYRDRRNRKRDFRRLWITRINAAARLNGMTYGSSSTASSWPASSSTARCWPTSPCAIPRRSADLPTPPARRRPPLRSQHQPTPRPHRASLLPRTAPFFRPMTITSPPQRQAQGGPPPRRRTRASAGASSPRARTCSRPPTPPAGRPSTLLRAGRRRARSSRAAARVSRAGLGHARARRLRGALVARPRARCASRSGASATPATSAPSLRGALAFGAASVALGPGLRRPVRRPRRCAPRWARSSRCRSRACVGRRAARPAVALGGRAAAIRCAGRRRGRRCWSAPSARACPARWSPPATRVAHIPIAASR